VIGVAASGKEITTRPFQLVTGTPSTPVTWEMSTGCLPYQRISQKKGVVSHIKLDIPEHAIQETGGGFL